MYRLTVVAAKGQSRFKFAVLANQRYSPLTQLNRDNVAGLKAEWRVSLGGSGVTPRGSNQAEPIYYDGTVYTATSENDELNRVRTHFFY